MEYINVTASNDLDMKINGILSIIVQDEGDTFVKRAEMYYQKRPELIQMVEDLQKSYRSLAEKYDQLRSQVQLQGLQNYAEGDEELNGIQYYSNFHSKYTAEDPDHEIEFDQDSSNELTPANSTKSSKMKPDEKKNVNGVAFQRNVSGDSQLENEKLWNELRFKVSELVEDNLSHQAELIRRNDEKRGKIRDLLCTKMNLVEEIDNRPKTSVHKVSKKTQSQLSRLRRLFLGRFTKSNAS